jgi:hypothetical protein
LGHEGTPACDFIDENETINAYRYIQTLQKRQQAIRRKLVGMLTRGVKLCITMQLPTLLENKT